MRKSSHATRAEFCSVNPEITKHGVLFEQVIWSILSYFDSCLNGCLADDLFQGFLSYSGVRAVLYVPEASIIISWPVDDAQILWNSRFCLTIDSIRCVSSSSPVRPRSIPLSKMCWILTNVWTANVSQSGTSFSGRMWRTPRISLSSAIVLIIEKGTKPVKASRITSLSC